MIEAAGSSQEVQAQTTKEDETEDQNPDYVIMDYLHPAFSWGGRSTPSKAMLRNRLIGTPHSQKQKTYKNPDNL